MRIGIPKEAQSEEPRVPVVPQTVKKLADLGAEVAVEAGMGMPSGFSDGEYGRAGASIVADRRELLSCADIVLRLNKPPSGEVSILKRGCIHVSFLDPFNSRELVEALAARGVSTVSMEMIPRTTKAQKMDALSSQANLGGYVAVILAADRLDSIFPMMITPAGTLSPARVFVIGAGVAGLQAIATAKRLGARVDAFDTRPVVAEQVRSLGARFLEIDLGETGETADGYAKQLTEEQLEKQRLAMAKACAQSDVVITTAQVFGRKAPLIVTEAMVRDMKHGSVIVDMAVESGGNVAGSKPGEEVMAGGVRIMGLRNLPGRVPRHASHMYSSNLANFLEEFWDAETKALALDPRDEIIRGCLLTRDGEICNERLKEAYTS